MITIASSPFAIAFIFWLIKLIKNRGKNKIGTKKETKKVSKKKGKRSWRSGGKKNKGTDEADPDMKSIGVGVRQKGKDHLTSGAELNDSIVSRLMHSGVSLRI